MSFNRLFFTEIYVRSEFRVKIYGLQKLTLLDYPQKTACTIFCGGCNFRCLFCHNSDLVLGRLGEPLDEEELFRFLKKRAGLLDGVCITGGEPLLNSDIGEFIKKIRRLGYLIKLDTNGSNPALLEKLVSEKLVDYVAMDIKNSPEKYGQTIGINNFDITPIRRSIEFLMTADIDCEFRTTVTKELHSDESMKGIAQMIAGAKRYFIQNYRDSDNVLSKGLSSVPPKQLADWQKLFENYVDFVQIRGE